MSDNPFLLEEHEYQRSLSPIRDWLKQTATYASIMLDKPFEQCLSHLEAKFKAKKIAFDDPIVVHYARKDGADRFEYRTPLSRYINIINKAGHVLVPTGTAYIHASKQPSLIVDYQDMNVKERARYKKLSQKYEAEGNKELQDLYHNYQDAKKRRNNAVSGLFGSNGSPIENKSAHSTLTSTTRSMSSLSNASNERLIEGNRHYYSPQIALNNLISIVAETDQDLVNEAVATFGLVHPTVEQTMQCIKRSLDMYCIDHRGDKVIQDFVERLTPAQRSAVVYTGDFYHIRVFNEDFTYRFIEELSRKGHVAIEDDMVAKLFKTNEQILNYACQINVEMLAGKGKDYEEKLTPEEQSVLLNTCRNIEQCIQKYKLLLRAFFLTKNSPCTISTIQSQVRRSVVLSDTDSTMFSTDSWVFWYFEQYNRRNKNQLSPMDWFRDIGYAAGGAVMFIATQSIGHLLAIFSANMNVERKRLFTLQMKPEFMFPVFGLTSVAKHYYTAMKIKEGNVYPDIKMEIKGVHMKDSTVPQNIIKAAAVEMEDNIRRLMRGDRIPLLEKIRKVVAIEQEIIRSLKAGEVTYLKRLRIKEASAYKEDPSKSPFQYSVIWDTCFADAYGATPQLPYLAFVVPLKMESKTERNQWLERIRNQDVKNRLTNYFRTSGKVALGSFPVPADIVNDSGIPPEFMDILDYERVVLSLTKSLRNTLESMGWFPKSKKLVSAQVLV